MYFALVLGTGFVLGMFRLPFLVPRIGERWAELAEMPIMAIAIFFYVSGSVYILLLFVFALMPRLRLPKRETMV